MINVISAVIMVLIIGYMIFSIRADAWEKVMEDSENDR